MVLLGPQLLRELDRTRVRSRRERLYRGDQAIARAQVTAPIPAFTPRMVIDDDSEEVDAHRDDFHFFDEPPRVAPVKR
jgi:hypothetical protein